MNNNQQSKLKEKPKVGGLFVAIVVLVTAVIFILVTLNGGGIEKTIMDEVERSNAVQKTKTILSSAQVYYDDQVVINGFFNNSQDAIIDFSLTTDNQNYKNKNTIEFASSAKAGQIKITPNAEITIIKAIQINDFYCGYSKNADNYDYNWIDCHVKETEIKVAP